VNTFFIDNISKSLAVCFLFLTTLFFTVSSAFGFSYGYLITRLTNNDYRDKAPQINNNGHVVWHGYSGNTTDIFLYTGTSGSQTTPINLTNSVYSDWAPQINDNGDIVWSSFDLIGEIILYDGTTTDTTVIQTPYLYDNAYPQINNNGFVTWFGEEYPFGGSYDRDTDIFLYTGTRTIQLINNDYENRAPQINDNGFVVWQGQDAEYSDSEIFLYDGTTTQLTDNDHYDGDPHINNNGVVVWAGYDGSDFEIFRYDGTTITPLTDNDYNDARPQINNNGSVVWEGREDSDSEIFLYDGTSITRLTHNNYDDYRPKINDNGDIVWEGSGPDGTDLEIFLYNGSTTIQLTDNDHDDTLPQINDNRWVVWEGFDGSDWEIFLSYPSLMGVVVEHMEIPWWKSEEYWGGEWRLPLSPREVDIDIAGIEPAPLPCPECAFSRAWQLNKMPSRFPYLHETAHDIFGRTGQSKSFKKNKERLITLLKNIPAGQRYSKKMKVLVIEALQGWDGSSSDASPISHQVLRAMNAIELDWRIPSLKATEIKTSKDLTVNFDGVAWVKFKEVKKAGKLSLNVDGNLPAIVARSRPGWPVANYQFDYTGELGDFVDISFYFGGYGFKGDPSSLHIFEWDGKSYKDITTIVDWSAKVITGRTNRLSTYIIAGPNLQKD